jgi:hypothetical protein
VELEEGVGGDEKNKEKDKDKKGKNEEKKTGQVSSYPPDSNVYLLMHYISYSLGRKINAHDTRKLNDVLDQSYSR